MPYLDGSTETRLAAAGSIVAHFTTLRARKFMNRATRICINFWPSSYYVDTRAQSKHGTKINESEEVLRKIINHHLFFYPAPCSNKNWRRGGAPDTGVPFGSGDIFRLILWRSVSTGARKLNADKETTSTGILLSCFSLQWTFRAPTNWATQAVCFNAG